ncbi:MAG: GIY-YIG nuclease family protein [Patescibacteria group bacterium]|nr:GIY-YIG nuclease family protein [Patescibacteria group bacterium]
MVIPRKRKLRCHVGARKADQSRRCGTTGISPCVFYFVYILRTSSNTLYVGQTNNLEKRLKEHKKKSPRSAKYLRYFTSSELVYYEKCLTRKESMQREAQLKRWPKAKKESLMGGTKRSFNF